MHDYVLGCLRTRDKDSTELSSWLRRKYKFLKMSDVPPGKSLVVPFMVVSDGHDVMGFVNPHGVLDLGFATVVKTDRHIVRSNKRFDKMVHANIKKNFLGLMEGTMVSLEDDVVEFSEDFFELIDTYHTVSSQDDMQIFPIYILKLANTRINMPEGNDVANFCPISKGWLKRNWQEVRMTHVSKLVADMLARGELKIPQTEEGVFRSIT